MGGAGALPARTSCSRSHHSAAGGRWFTQTEKEKGSPKKDELMNGERDMDSYISANRHCVVSFA